MSGDPILMGEMFIGRACDKCVINILEKYNIPAHKGANTQVEIGIKDLRSMLTIAHRAGRVDSREQR